jgi:hypothetical protein
VTGPLSVDASLGNQAGRPSGLSGFAATVYPNDSRGGIGCCDRPVIVQVRNWSETVGFWFDRPGGWTVDDQTIYKSCASRGSCTWTDLPGVKMDRRWWTVRHRTRQLKQNFESCVVCMDSDRCGEVLGCLKWGHHWGYWGGGIRGGRWIWDADGLRQTQCPGTLRAEGARRMFASASSWYHEGADKAVAHYCAFGWDAYSKYAAWDPDQPIPGW